MQGFFFQRKDDLFLIHTKVLPRVVADLEGMEDSRWRLDHWVSQQKYRGLMEKGPTCVVAVVQVTCEAQSMAHSKYLIIIIICFMLFINQLSI